MGRWGEGGDKGDKERSLSGGFRPSELRRKRLLPCLPCPLSMPNAQCPMPHARCPMPNAQ
ncbi:histidine kinase [Nostoc linckia]|uniref:histidine kinase n=1 Tax=Nostoc linckia TaxID=92942 RepID=UPI0015D4A077|nr:histidine kinase [Nostoc linckia]